MKLLWGKWRMGKINSENGKRTILIIALLFTEIRRTFSIKWNLFKLFIWSLLYFPQRAHLSSDADDDGGGDGGKKKNIMKRLTKMIIRQGRRKVSHLILFWWKKSNTQIKLCGCWGGVSTEQYEDDDILNIWTGRNWNWKFGGFPWPFSSSYTFSPPSPLND